jgi:hypothetical protein
MRMEKNIFFPKHEKAYTVRIYANFSFHHVCDFADAFATTNQSYPLLSAAQLTECSLLVNCCLSDATAHKHIGFGLPKWFMFLLVVVHKHCPTTSRKMNSLLSITPKA